MTRRSWWLWWPAWLLPLFLVLACGTDVNLGGTADGSDARGASDARGTCTTFAPPATAASCTGCSHGSPSCQANGCFNSYFCDPVGHYCKPPGTACAPQPDAH